MSEVLRGDEAFIAALRAAMAVHSDDPLIAAFVHLAGNSSAVTFVTGRDPDVVDLVALADQLLRHASELLAAELGAADVDNVDARDRLRDIEAARAALDFEARRPQ